MNIYCCELMKLLINDARLPIRYLPLFREYRLLKIEDSERFSGYKFIKNPLLFGKTMSYCPWCGKKFLPSLQSEWEKEVLAAAPEVNPDTILEVDTLPERLQTDLWWRDQSGDGPT